MFSLETERLTIRRFAPGDWRDLHAYLSQKETVRYEPYGVFTEDECKAEAVRRAGDECFLAVCLKESGRCIGNIWLKAKDFDTFELGYVFNGDFHGMGYATEAARRVVDDAFQNRDAWRVEAMCCPENVASWRLMERLGMRREGHLRKNAWFKKDEDRQPIWMDTYMYGVLAEEWRLIKTSV